MAKNFCPLLDIWKHLELAERLIAKTPHRMFILNLAVIVNSFFLPQCNSRRIERSDNGQTKTLIRAKTNTRI